MSRMYSILYPTPLLPLYWKTYTSTLLIFLHTDSKLHEDRKYRKEGLKHGSIGVPIALALSGISCMIVS